MSLHSHEVAHRIPALTTREVLSLAAFQAAPYRVLSLYLEADLRGQELATIRSRAHSLLHQAHEALERQQGELEHAVHEAARADLKRCRAFIDTFRPRGACRGLALFSCAGRDWWQHYPLPRPVPDRTEWGSEPLILPAVRLLEEYPRTGVILVDREQGRYFGSRLGEVEELAAMREEVPQRVREGGSPSFTTFGRWYGLDERRIERHIEDHVRRHLKHVAAEARTVFRAWPVSRLLVGGNAELLEDFRHCLHPSLHDRWMKDLGIVANASLEEVGEAVLAAEQELAREREAALLRQVYDEWGAAGYGVVGVRETLRALYLGEVQTLLVDGDLRLSGYRCDTCSALFAADDRCPLCGAGALRAVADLVDEAMEETFAHGGQVEVVGEHAEFRRDGGMGALLRFRPVAGDEGRAAS